jgi:hypothetical protein
VDGRFSPPKDARVVTVPGEDARVVVAREVGEGGGVVHGQE